MTRMKIAVAAALFVACAHRQQEGMEASVRQDVQAGPSTASQEQVRIIQRSLTSQGFAVDPTGQIDAATRTALADFQRTRGLASSGRADAETLAALGIAPGDVTPVRGETSAATAQHDANEEAFLEQTWTAP